MVTATKQANLYITKGYTKTSLYSANAVRRTGGSIIGYVDNIAVYNTIDAAVSDATRIGCSGYHTHTINGEQGYMACGSHDEIIVTPGGVGDYRGPTNQLTIKHVDGGPINRCCPVTNQPGFPGLHIYRPLWWL